MKAFIKELIVSHIKVLNALLKEYKEMGGDTGEFTTLGDPTDNHGCSAKQYWNGEKCVDRIGD